MDLIKKSVALSWQNLILIVPFLMEAAIRFAVIIPLLILLGWVGFANNNLSSTDNITELLVVAGTVGFVFLLGYYMLHSFVLSGLYGMIKVVLEEQETVKMSQFFAYGKRYIWKAFSIQLVVYLFVYLLAIPLVLYFRAELLSPELMETIPFGLFGVTIVYLFVSMVTMLVAQFSILSVVRDDTPMRKAIGLSFKIMTKGVKDCLILLGVSLLLLLPVLAVLILLNFIPVVGSVAFMALQYFLLVILLVWTVLFYDKYKEEECS